MALRFIRKYYIYLIYLCIAVAVQASLAFFLAYEPNYDVKSVFDGAVAVAETGKLTEELTEYFAWASNNFGLMFIMSVVFKIFGSITGNYFMIFAFTNIVLVNAAVFFLYSLVRRACGAKASYIVLILLFLYIPMYFFPSMIYTDTATMFVPIGCLYLITARGRKAPGCGHGSRVIYWSAS